MTDQEAAVEMARINAAVTIVVQDLLNEGLLPDLSKEASAYLIRQFKAEPAVDVMSQVNPDKYNAICKSAEAPGIHRCRHRVPGRTPKLEDSIRCMLAEGHSSDHFFGGK